MQQNYKNRGVRLGERNTDYRADRVGGNLIYEVRQEDGNWQPFLPPGEWQANDNGDSMSCVSFGHLNSVETQEKKLTGKQVNYSDRWIAKMSNTNRQGNYLYAVADAIREYGMVLEEDYPTPKSYTWEEYHAEIPEPLKSQLIIKGRTWLEKWSVSYEWVATDKASLLRHIKQAPLSVVLPGHMVLNFYTTQDIINFFDSYPPYLKTTKEIQGAMKVVLTQKDLTDPDLVLANIEYGEFGSKVTKLLKALRRLGWGVGESEKWGDLYDYKVKELVFEYQLSNLNRYGWSWWWILFFYRGRIVDATTRENINNNLLKRK